VTWTVRDLGTLGGRSSRANAINRLGVIVGTSNVAGSQQLHAFVWRNGVMTDLGTLAGRNSAATGVNAYGGIAPVPLASIGPARS
jgi:probable HAF family extracellular repeat protein